MGYESFAVEPAALDRLAADLDAQADTAQRARAYVARHGAFSIHESGLVGYFLSPHQSYLDSLLRRIGHLEDLLRESAAEVRRSARYYQGTDAAAAARFDKVLPGVTAATIEVT